MSHQPQVDCDTCSASFTKLTLALLLVVPVGAAVYFWRKKCILEHQLHNLEAKCKGKDDFGLSIQKRRDDKNVEEPLNHSLTIKENVRYLNKTLNETNLKLLDLMETVICLTEHVQTIHCDNKAIVERLNMIENKRAKIHGRRRIEERCGVNTNSFTALGLSDKLKRTVTLDDVYSKQEQIVEGLCWLARQVEKLKEDQSVLKDSVISSPKESKQKRDTSSSSRKQELTPKNHHPLEKIGLNRSRKKSRINQELHQKSLIGSGIKGESKSFYQTSMGFSSRLNAEYQKNIVHKEKEACIPTNLKKESKLQKPTEIVHIKDPYSKKNLAGTVNWLSKTLQATNMSLFELMEAVMQVTNDVKVLHGDNLYILRRLTVLENQCPKSQRKL